MDRSIARPRKGTNAQLRGRVAELSNELAATRAQLEDANKDVTLATTRAEQAERDLDRETRHAARLSADFAHIHSRSKRQGDALYQTRKQMSKLRAERDTLKGDLGRTRSALAQVTAERDQALNNAESLRDEVDRVSTRRWIDEADQGARVIAALGLPPLSTLGDVADAVERMTAGQTAGPTPPAPAPLLPKPSTPPTFWQRLCSFFGVARSVL